MYNLESLPVEIDFEGIPVKQITAGENMGGAVDNEGGAYVWGGKDIISPLKLELEGRKAREVRVGNRFALILTEDGELLSMGRGNTGCLGHGDTSTLTIPQNIQFFANEKISSFSCGPLQASVITS